MCGLFGAFCHTYLSQHEKNRALMLGFLSQIRGVDSTGFVYGFLDEHKKKKLRQRFYGIRKSVGDAVSFFQQEATKQALAKDSINLILGHCRAATVGDVSIETAHPFHYGKLMGAHNGTISAFSKVEGKSDSMVLYEKLANSTLPQLVQEAEDGAMALTYIDLKTNTLNFYRNTQRPLFIHTAGTTIYWASEKRMIDFMLNESTSTSFGKTEMLSPHTHIKFDLGNGSRSEEKVPEYTRIYKYTKKFYHPYQGSALAGGWDGEYDFERSYRDAWKEEEEKKTALNKDLIEKVAEDISKEMTRKAQVKKRVEQGTSVPIVNALQRQVYVGENAHEYPLFQAKNDLEEGCSFCNTIMDVEDPVYWYRMQGDKKRHYICEDCLSPNEGISHTTAVMQYLGVRKLWPSEVKLVPNLKQSSEG